MCLLIHHKPGTDLTPEILSDILRRNSDGFGAMFAENGRVHVIKNVNPTDREVAYLYNRYLRHRECVIHFRMRTHGDVDYDNCHPYQVFESLHMAHNGVMGNIEQPDKSKSDTWHLVENYLKPILARDPTILFTAPFQKMLASYVGSGNKLGFVHKSGKVVVINRASGFEAKGSWFSNTYAWNPERFGMAPPRAATVTRTYGGTRGQYADYAEAWDTDGVGSIVTPRKATGGAAKPATTFQGTEGSASGASTVQPATEAAKETGEQGAKPASLAGSLGEGVRNTLNLMADALHGKGAAVMDEPAPLLQVTDADVEFVPATTAEIVNVS